MIKNLVRKMLLAQIVSALTVTLCLLIDNIIIGRFLGEEAIAAYGLSNPLLLVIGGIGMLMASGIQVVCSKSLGSGSKKETNSGYSSALATAGGVSVLFLIIVVLFRSPIASAMGAGTEGTLFEQTRDYLLGFSIGAPASLGSLVLVPFLQMGGQSGLLVVAVLSMTFADVGLDLLNVLVFDGGMLGMGLASSLSYYLAMIISAFYFLSKRCAFKFSFKLVSIKKIMGIFAGGIPSGINILSTVIMVFIMNHILKAMGDAGAVAAFSVVTTIGNVSNCISTGFSGVSLTLSGIFFNEEDKTSLRQLMRLLARYSVILGASVGVILLILAPVFVKLFIPNPGDVQNMATIGVRFFAAGLIPCCLNYTIKSSYQAMGRPILSEIISLVEGTAIPVVVAFILSRFIGTFGAWFYFASGELLMVVLICLYIRVKTGQKPWNDGAYLLLKKDFGQTPDNMMEADIYTIEDVTAVAEEAQRFGEEHGQSKILSNHIALCIEEMAGNTILHGFTKDGKKHHLSVRVMRKPDHWLLRFRDDCGSFDPVNYVPREGKDALGIQLVLAMADEVKYTYSLNLNNLMIKLPVEET